MEANAPMNLNDGMMPILSDQLGSMAEAFVRLLPQMTIALVILMLTWLLAKGGSRVARRVIGKAEVRPSLVTLVETAAKILIWIGGVMLAITILLPDVTPANILAVLGLGSVAIGFAFKDIFENFLAGVLIMIREKMRIGDVIECEGIEGKVEAISLRETYVRRGSNEVTIVPNAILFKNPVEIFTDTDARRHQVVCGVSYDSDLGEAAQVIETAVKGCSLIDTERKIDVFASEFGDSSINFLIRWWSGSTPRDGHESRDQVVRAVYQALDQAGIEIPFPHITHTFGDAVPISEQSDG